MPPDQFQTPKANQSMETGIQARFCRPYNILVFILREKKDSIEISPETEEVQSILYYEVKISETRLEKDSQ